MPRPKIKDNGQIVEIDLHGLWVDDALDAISDVIELSAERGRTSVRVIHGSSTSDNLAHNRTIKHAFLHSLDNGAFPDVISVVRYEGKTLLSLASLSTQDPRPISLRDLY